MMKVHIGQIQIVTIALCIALFTQCRGGKTDIAARDSVVTVDVKNMRKETPGNDLFDINMVALETSDDALVGVVKSLHVSENSIYLFDVNNNFFVFDRLGKLRFRSQPRGRGPKEFLSISEFAVDTRSGDIFIYDNMLLKVLVFDEQGNCRKELQGVDNKVLAGATEMTFTDDGKLLANLCFAPGFNHYYAVFDTKKDCRLDKYLLRYPYRWNDRSFDGAKPKISRNKDGVYMTSILSDTIYRLQTYGDIFPAYVINSGSEPVSHERYSDVEDYFELTQIVTRDKRLTRGVKNILMTNQIGYTGLYYYDDCVNHIFWNLMTGEGYIFPQTGSNDDILTDLNLMSATDDAFVGIIYPDRISEQQLSTDPRFVNLKSVKPDDNPIIVFYGLKKRNLSFSQKMS